MPKRTAQQQQSAATTLPALILVVEDNPITRKSVRLTLQAEGFQVAEAEDGRSAMAAMQRQTPDLVLLDLLLPDIHGAELIKQLRSLPGASDIPILAFSGLVSRIEEARIADAGFTDFLLKPVEPSRLVRVVANYLVRQSSAIDQPGKGKRVLLVDDDPVQLKMLRLQFEHVGFEVETADHGATALELARRQPPHVIVTDLLMPHLDGFDLCVEVRRDPVLRELPIVVLSANYVEAADQDLAQRMGASAYVFRDDGFDALLAATLTSLARPVQAAIAISPELERARYKRIVRQLERQTILHAASVQRNIIQSAILHELGLLAEILAKRKDLESTLDELLAYCLDGAGLSKGVFYLAEADAGLALRAQYGCLPCAAEARSFFGAQDLFQRVLHSGDTLILPSAGIDAAQAESLLARAQARSALIVPVRAGDQALAVLLLLSLHRDLMEEDWLAFGRALAAQIGQSVALSRTFLRLAESEQRYRSLFEAAKDAIVVTDDDGRVLDANPAACALVGYPLEALRSMHVGQWLVGDDQQRWATTLDDFRRTGQLVGEFTYAMRSGTVKTAEVHGTRIAPRMCLYVARDITERKRAAETIARLAYRDSLTDLANRVTLQARLQADVGQARSRTRPLALLLIDLASFRDINDTLGHANGDQVLIQVAQRLQGLLWESDLVARLGADEFAVLLPRLSSPADIDAVLRKIRDGFMEPFIVADVPIDVQPAIGVALFPQHAGDADTLFRRADIALNAAKVQRRANVVYSASVDHFHPQQLSLMAELRGAIARDELLLHYQPKIHLQTGANAGTEALVRWLHPKRGLLPPGEFIPLAEKTRLIDDLTASVLHTALRQWTDWRAAGDAIEIAVNVSARNLLDQHFVSGVVDAVTRAQCDPGHLVMELTESAIMADPRGAQSKMQELHAFGIRFAIDDFGTGYSSLAYLKDLPVSELKIDRSFTAQIDDPGVAAIVRGTIDLAHNLGLSVVAEGIEDQATAERLQAEGCDIGQGYYYSRPVPATDLLAWWHARRGSTQA